MDFEEITNKFKQRDAERARRQSHPAVRYQTRPVPRHLLTVQGRRLLAPTIDAWWLIDDREAQSEKNLRSDDTLQILAFDGMRWKKVDTCIDARRYEQWYAFTRPVTQVAQGGGGASSNTRIPNLAQSNLYKRYAPKMTDSYLNTDPRVHIGFPNDGETLSMDNGKQFKNHTADYTVQAGDTLASIAQTVAQTDDIRVITDHNTKDHYQPLQPGQTIKVCIGRQLRVDGEVENSRSVNLNWQGPTNDSHTNDNTQGNPNQTIGWDVRVPVKPGVYTFTATASGAVSNTVKVTIKDKKAIAMRIGVFFDGTGNNMVNDLSTGEDSNIVRLFELYNAPPEKITTEPVGKHGGLDLYTAKTYQNGVGTKDYEPKSDYGMAVGTKAVSRINAALKNVESFIKQHQDKGGPRIIDVFGFSRGAASARDFINQVHEKLSGVVTEVAFVGLYDTVGSFGVAGNKTDIRSDRPLADSTSPVMIAIKGLFNFNLNASSATKIVHYTSMHEIRANFDLHSLRTSEGAALPDNMEEITVPGVHADVGGGYGIKPEVSIDKVERRSMSYYTLGVNWQTTFQKKKQRLLDEAESRGLTLQYEGTTSNAANESTDTYWLVKKRTVQPGLSNVYLRAMYEKSARNKVPMNNLSNDQFRDDIRFIVPYELEKLINIESLKAINKDKLYEHYVHMSHRDWEDGNEDARYIANYPNSDGKRDIYYNEPNQAKQPKVTTK